jgi:hypothetical protein
LKQTSIANKYGGKHIQQSRERLYGSLQTQHGPDLDEAALPRVVRKGLFLALPEHTEIA